VILEGTKPMLRKYFLINPVGEECKDKIKEGGTAFVSQGKPCAEKCLVCVSISCVCVAGLTQTSC
jgi:hypothetical protein